MENTLRDYVSLKLHNVPKDKKTKYIDSVLNSIKEKGKDSLLGLQVNLKATHAGKLTGHFHYYDPGKVRVGAKTFTKDFEKPVLKHHRINEDPIGRAKKATYISAAPSFIGKDILALAEKNKKHNETTLQYIDKLKPFLFDRNFQGLGYIDLVTLITDEDAIVKVLDERYLTVSIGYGTNSVHCSICKQDWYKGEICEHRPGKVYDNEIAFLIFGDLIYKEVSFVNPPANSLSTVTNKKIVRVPVMTDFTKGGTQLINDIMADNTNHYIECPDLVPESPYNYFVCTKDGIYMPPNYFNENKSGDNMNKFAEIFELGQDGFYEKIKEFLPKDSVKSTQDLSEYADEEFAGTNRTFPAFDKEHIDACRKFLESLQLEDSNEKTETLQYLDTHETSLSLEDSNIDEPTTEVIPEETESETEVIPEETQNDATTEVTFEDSLNSFMTTNSVDSLVALIAASMSEDKQVELETSLSKNFKFVKELQDSNTNLKTELDNAKIQYQKADTALKTAFSNVDKLSKELREFYIDKIISMKDKEDPSKNKEDLKNEFNDKTLKEIKAAHDIIKSVFLTNSDSTSTLNIEVEGNDSHSFDTSKAFTDEQYNKAKDSIEKKASQIKSVYGDSVGNNYFLTQMAALDARQNSNKTENK
jgi:hypothetical protein